MYELRVVLPKGTFTNVYFQTLDKLRYLGGLMDFTVRNDDGSRSIYLYSETFESLEALLSILKDRGLKVGRIRKSSKE